MAVSSGNGSTVTSSLFSTLRSLWAVLLATFYTRLDLATVEMEEIGTHAVKLIAYGLAALLSAAMTVFFLMFLLIVVLWDYRDVVLPIVFVVSLILTVVLALITRSMVTHRPKFFEQTLAELRRDVEGLRPEIISEKPQP